MARIAIIGAGYVGLVTGVAFARAKHDVVCADMNAARVRSIRQGMPPFYEAGLSEALQEVLRNGRLDATTDSEKAVRKADFIFLCVGTPNKEDGTMDESALTNATHDVARGLAKGSGDKTIVLKSTVVPGTTERIVRPILFDAIEPDRPGLAVNPEFLREGSALRDAERPDRIVVGADRAATAARMRELYRNVDCPIVETDLRTAEAIKLATNAFLATKVAFANELARLCQAFGVSYDEVIRAVTLDPRISPRFLVPGVGFGGSCLPKDLRALVAAGKASGYEARLLETVVMHNEVQYLEAIKLLEEELGDLQGKRIALLGLAFKGGSDDVRESRAIPIAKTLLAKGATVIGYDPVASENFSSVVPSVHLVDNVEETLQDADGCLLQAEWTEFSQLTASDFLRYMRTPVVVDGRRILSPKQMKGVRFRRIG